MKSLFSIAARCTEIWLKEGLTKATNRLHAFKAQ